jgi:hypothetical protein
MTDKFRELLMQIIDVIMYRFKSIYEELGHKIYKGIIPQFKTIVAEIPMIEEMVEELRAML